MSSSALVPNDPVAEHADLVDLQLDNIAGREVPTLLQPAAGTYGTRAEHLARVERLALGDEGDDIGEGVVHGRARAPTPLLSVDPGHHGEGLWVAALVGGDDPGAEDVAGVEVLPLGRAELARHLPELDVAG